MNQETPTVPREELVSLTTDVVTAFVSNNSVPAEALPGLLHSTFKTINGLSGRTRTEEQEQKPAVPVKKSVQDDHLICLEDGKKVTMLKRYLRTNYDMSPEEYRRKWNLPADYPMSAPSYTRKRSAIAKDIGLGRGASRPATKKTRKQAGSGA